ncbi:MAG: hypothetical protein GC165_07375 [Armatimonadetes bacterium]|nr:hypothetical protein [Armatimonadota bacterium]
MIADLSELRRRFMGPDAASEIMKAVANNIGESANLEFKQLNDKGMTVQDGSFPKDLRVHLAENVSAFANQAGGIIVWGVECRKNQPMAAWPFPHCEKVRDVINDVSLNIVEPATEIETTAVPLENGVGFAVTYVPPAKVKPVMCTFNGDKRYYWRNGESAIAMDHGLVRALMLATARPELELRTTKTDVIFEGLSTKSPDPSYRVTIEYTILNVGQVLVSEFAVVLTSCPNGTRFSTDGNLARKTGQTSLDDDNMMIDGSVIVHSSPDLKLFPKSGIRFVSIKFHTNNLEGKHEFRGLIVAKDASVPFEFSVDMSSISGREQALQKYREALSQRQLGSPPRTSRFI